MILSISEHIYKVLSTTSALVALVGDRIYPLGTKSEVSFPFLVYERDNVEVDYDKAAYTQSLTLAEIVVNALDKVEASYTGFNVVDAHLAAASEDFVENTFVQRINFRFQITENNG